jgi:hypothetical protein
MGIPPNTLNPEHDRLLLERDQVHGLLRVERDHRESHAPAEYP